MSTLTDVSNEIIDTLGDISADTAKSALLLTLVRYAAPRPLTLEEKIAFISHARTWVRAYWGEGGLN